MRLIMPIASVVLAMALVLGMAMLIANDALARERCRNVMGDWNSGLLGGRCQATLHGLRGL